ncbi:hypothetical protein [Algoriphagus sediminis]|uniref:Uncharacterized protein n=1 Tax=Algoriphagus sediminis TaxID=3057113 RepID=A0ABT7YGR8_9BACT|nr:hypothetical protein [Algoriphagus sediminis]MDN3205663.1 hypothetical protein [Algoriphagus sediminis]
MDKQEKARTMLKMYHLWILKNEKKPRNQYLEGRILELCEVGYNKQEIFWIMRAAEELSKTELKVLDFMIYLVMKKNGYYKPNE